MTPPTLAEMTAWSVEQIREAVTAMLPPGWALSLTSLGPFRAVLRDNSDKIVWSHDSFDERLLLLDAFGWLLLRNVQRPTEGPWKSRERELTQRVVTIDAQAFADPPDLDPEVLDAVYCKTPDKQGRGG